MKSRYVLALLLASACAVVSAQRDQTQSLDPSLYQDLRYRLIGPFRASRTVGAVGVPTQPGVFFMGVNNGGVWKTDDYGRTWTPDLRRGADRIGRRHRRLAVASGRASTSAAAKACIGPISASATASSSRPTAARTWQHVGLPDVQQVGRIVVHPTNPDIVFVAAMGHPYGPNEERGVFRTTDGGRTWEKVLYVDHNTGAAQVEFDPANPHTCTRRSGSTAKAPWENGSFSGPNSGLYKSIDGGTDVAAADGRPAGRPAAALGRIIFAVAPSNPTRLYALVGGARRPRRVSARTTRGETWRLVSTDRGSASTSRCIRRTPTSSSRPARPRIARTTAAGRGRPSRARRAATTPSASGSTRCSPTSCCSPPTRARRSPSTAAARGVPGTTSRRRSSITSTTDNQFPYWVYGGQQESGAIGIASRGNGGQISFRDWIGVGADEYAYVAPDPLEPGHRLRRPRQRFNRKTGQSQNVAPEALRSGRYRILRTMPLLFHPADPKMLLFATNVLWKTTTGGQQWEIISPDLSRERPDVPESVGDFRTPDLETMPRRGVIYAVGPSPKDVNVIWAGTDDGLVHVTRDGGKTWQNVTPPALRAWDKVSQLDAGHFDAKTAYVAVNAIRRDDMRPHIYRTHDGGATWTRDRERPAGDGPGQRRARGSAAAGSALRGHRTAGLLLDRRRRSLAVAAAEHAGLVGPRPGDPRRRSGRRHARAVDLDSGQHRAAAGARGRGARERAFLFRPPLATRVRWNMFSDTPLPPEEPAGQNPPDGAMLDYYLPRGDRRGDARDPSTAPAASCAASRAATSRSESIRRRCRIRPTGSGRRRRSSTERGHHRFVWDLRYRAAPGRASASCRSPRSIATRRAARRAVRAPGPLHGPADRRRRDSRASASTCAWIRA